MPIISYFPTGGNGGSSGVPLEAVSNITTVVSHGKVYFKWTDPEDIAYDDIDLATFYGTILVRKPGSAPVSHRDGTIILDCQTRNAYQNSYFCDSGLTDGVTYYYKFFTYSKQGAYNNLDENLVEITPAAIAPADVSNMSIVSAGNGKVTLKWTDPEDITQNGITVTSWGGSKVIYKEGSAPTSENDGVLALNSTTKNAYKSTGLTISGLTNGKTYYFAVFPYATTAYGGAVNTNKNNVVSCVPNRFTISNVPSQSGSLTYNGNDQTPSWNNYDSSKMTLSVTAQINAGTYTATFTPLNDYMWSDGSIAAKSVNWTINKAAGSLSLSAESVVLNSNTKSTTITVTRVGNGEITAKSSDTSIATVSVNGNIITISSVNDKTGTATITVSVAAGTNHAAPANKSCSVNCEFFPPVGTPLNNMTWEQIRKVSDDGLASSYFAIGDRKAVTLNGTVGVQALNGTYYCYIIGINHNSGKEGSNRIHFQFGYSALSDGVHIAFVDSKYNTNNASDCFHMNGSSTNVGGWVSSYARNTLCSQFQSALPSDLQTVLKTVTKYTDNTGNGYTDSYYITETTETIFLLSEWEVFGKTTYANAYEKNYQAQYAWYSAGNSTKRYRHNSTGSGAFWWLRSAYVTTSTGFCIAYESGLTGYFGARYSGGFSPAFCV